MDASQFNTQITFIYVGDLDRSAAFYEGILRFPLVLDQGGCRIVQTAGGGRGYLGYCQSEDKLGERSGIIITLVTPEVDMWYEYLIDKGVEVLGPPSENSRYEIYQFFLKDPDGYTLEIQTFLNPAWEKGVIEAGWLK